MNSFVKNTKSKGKKSPPAPVKKGSTFSNIKDIYSGKKVTNAFSTIAGEKPKPKPSPVNQRVRDFFSGALVNRMREKATGVKVPLGGAKPKKKKVKK